MLDELEEKREEEKQEEGGRQGERNKTLNEEGEGDLTTPPWTGWAGLHDERPAEGDSERLIIYFLKWQR